MGRRPRVDHLDAVHHVMNRGVNHEPVFFADADRIEFGRRLADIHETAGVDTLAYCLMGNHYHVLLRSNGNLSEAMQRLGSGYATATNRRIGRDGPLFRGRFHSIEVTDDSYLLAAIRYIHRNALDLPGVTSVDQYRWSSARSHLGLRPSPPFLDVDFVRGLFGDDNEEFLEFHSVPYWSNPRAESEPTTDVRTLRSLIELAIAEDDLRHGTDHNPPQRLDRTIAVLIAHTGGPVDVVRAATELGRFSSEPARRMAISRARSRFTADPSVRRVMAVLAGRLGLAPAQAA